MKDPLFTCEKCHRQGTCEETILKGYCHKRSAAVHYAEGVKPSLKEKLKRKSAFPNKIQARSWNRKYGK